MHSGNFLFFPIHRALFIYSIFIHCSGGKNILTDLFSWFYAIKIVDYLSFWEMHALYKQNMRPGIQMKKTPFLEQKTISHNVDKISVRTAFDLNSFT